LRKIRQKALHALAFLAVRHIILVDFLKIIVDLAGDAQLWPCPISPDTSDGMMMPGEKDDDTQQKNIH